MELNDIDNALSGVIKRVSRKEISSTQAKREISNIISSRTIASIRDRFRSKAEAGILATANDLSADDQKKLIDGKLRTVDSFIYVAKEVTDWSGSNKMIDNTDKSVGVLSLDNGGKIPTGENHSISQVKVAYGYATSVSQLGVTDCNYVGEQNNDVLFNSDMQIWEDSNLLATIPISAITKRDSESDDDLPVLELNKPINLFSTKKLEIKIETPTGKSIGDGTNKYFFKVMLLGVKTTVR